jgi:hypothetical protein
MHRDHPETDAHCRTIAGLLDELLTETAHLRRAFAATAPMVGVPHLDRDVVFVDDLTKCIDCSWARVGATRRPLPPDIVSECVRLLAKCQRLLRQARNLRGTNEPRDFDDDLGRSGT